MKFRSLDLLKVTNGQALSPARLKSLHFSRSLSAFSGALISAVFTAIPGFFFYSYAVAPVHPIDFPLSIKTGLLFLLGTLFVLSLIFTFLLARRPWVDPIARYLRNPFGFKVKKGQLIGGEVPVNSQGRRRGSQWLGQITLEDDSLILSEMFSRSIMESRDNKFFPVPAWVLVDTNPNTVRKILAANPNPSIRQILWQDLRCSFAILLEGASEILIGLDASAIESVPKNQRSSRDDLYLGAGILLVALIAVFLQWQPGIPDGRWLEVKAGLAKMNERETNCKALKPEDLLSAELAESWFKDLQYAAENIDFDSLSEADRNLVRSVFFENCREKALANFALARITDPQVEKVVLNWVNDVATYPRSVARLEMARDLAGEFIARIGNETERKNFETWAAEWTAENPNHLTNPKDVVLWIRRRGNTLREWYYPFQGRISNKI